MRQKYGTYGRATDAFNDVVYSAIGANGLSSSTFQTWAARQKRPLSPHSAYLVGVWFGMRGEPASVAGRVHDLFTNGVFNGETGSFELPHISGVIGVPGIVSLNEQGGSYGQAGLKGAIAAAESVLFNLQVLNTQEMTMCLRKVVLEVMLSQGLNPGLERDVNEFMWSCPSEAPIYRQEIIDLIAGRSRDALSPEAEVALAAMLRAVTGDKKYTPRFLRGLTVDDCMETV